MEKRTPLQILNDGMENDPEGFRKHVEDWKEKHPEYFQEEEPLRLGSMEEKNLLLAQYMGAVVLGEYHGSKGGYSDTKLLDFGKSSGSLFPENQRYWSDTQLKYHLSHDWLMPVVYKLGEQFELCAYCGRDRFPTLEELHDSVVHCLLKHGLVK